MRQRPFPSLYQIKTRDWLSELSPALGRPATLDDIPDQRLADIARRGFDWVWFLGVWQTGFAGREVSRHHPDWRQDYRKTLPDVEDADICGSPFAITSYSVHAELGDTEALARLRQRLRKHGLRLLLDFVPNHTAPDHPWVQERPDFYIRGTDANLAEAPHNYLRRETPHGSLVFACGRDPYSSGWPDTLQLDYRQPDLREAMIGELAKVARLCDGVRCDMAMLVLPDVFAQTWKDAPGTPEENWSFWPEAIARVRAEHPAALFMAEVYWDLEWELQQQGFDYAYDKTLYDRLGMRDADARGVRRHLQADHDFQAGLARFLENHDEPRAAAVFPPQRHQAAAVVTFMVPGLRFFHDGQLEGRRVKSSVHLRRRPEELADPTIRAFYDRLCECLRRRELREGRWRLLECHGWEDNASWKQFIAFTWEGPGHERLLVVVNYGAMPAQCRVPLSGLGTPKILLRDLMSSAVFERDRDEVSSVGVFLDMPGWGYHVFEVVS